MKTLYVKNVGKMSYAEMRSAVRDLCHRDDSYSGIAKNHFGDYTHKTTYELNTLLTSWNKKYK